MKSNDVGPVFIPAFAAMLGAYLVFLPLWLLGFHDSRAMALGYLAGALAGAIVLGPELMADDNQAILSFVCLVLAFVPLAILESRLFENVKRKAQRRKPSPSNHRDSS